MDENRDMLQFGHFAYVSVLFACIVGTLPLEIVLRARVYRRPIRLLLTLLPVVIIFIVWDLYAISSGHWDFDSTTTTTIRFAGGLPLDEVLFFIAIPICSILTLEAVRSLSGLPVGDERTEEREATK